MNDHAAAHRPTPRPHGHAPQSFHTLEAFYAADATRRTSPEWDFGVHWWEGRPFPTHRLTWVVETGELYLLRFGREGAEGTVRVLAVIPKVGDYPYGDSSAWAAFKNAQTVERVLDGWAEQGGNLGWLRERLAKFHAEVVARERTSRPRPVRTHRRTEVSR